MTKKQITTDIFLNKKCEIVTITYAHKGVIKSITSEGIIVEKKKFTNVFTGKTTVKTRFIPMTKIRYITVVTVRKNKNGGWFTKGD